MIQFGACTSLRTPTLEYRFDDVDPVSALRSHPGQRIEDATVTVLRAGRVARTTHVSAGGRFSIRMPWSWIDDECTLSIDSKDYSGQELPCSLAIGKPASGVVCVAAMLPEPSSSTLTDAVASRPSLDGDSADVSPPGGSHATEAFSLEAALVEQLARLQAVDD